MNAQHVRDAFDYLTQAELDYLRELIMRLPPGPVIINIGAGAGTSGLLFLETRDDTVVTTIDITDQSSPFGCLEGERVVVRQAGLGDLMGTRWFQIHGDSKAAGRAWKGPRVDLLFIDGDHTYEGCAGDLDNWLRHVRPGGYIAIHDYRKEAAWKSRNPDVEITDEIRGKVIKPYPGVDEAVDIIMRPSYSHQMVALVDSLVVFK